MQDALQVKRYVILKINYVKPLRIPYTFKGRFFGKKKFKAKFNNTDIMLWHSHNNMKIFGLSLHQGNTESRKCTEQRLIFKIGTLSPAGINERFSFS